MEWPIPKDVADIRSFMGITVTTADLSRDYLRLHTQSHPYRKRGPSLFGRRSARTVLIS
jgi:hypothetical protein